MSTSFQVTFDCVDADRMAEFWALALGYRVQPPPDGFDSWEAFIETVSGEAPEAGSASAIIDPDGDGPRVMFIQVPEPKTVKNRVHLDLRSGDTDNARAAKVAELVAAGATEVVEREEYGARWVVLRDPEGNEFCVS